MSGQSQIQQFRDKVSAIWQLLPSGGPGYLKSKTVTETACQKVVTSYNTFGQAERASWFEKCACKDYLIFYSKKIRNTCGLQSYQFCSLALNGTAMEHIELNVIDLFSALPTVNDLVNIRDSLIPFSKQLFYDVMPATKQVFYDVALAVSVSSCKEPPSSHQPSETEQTVDSDGGQVAAEEPMFWSNVLSVLNFGTSQPPASEPLSLETECEAVVSINTSTRLPLLTLACIFVIAAASMLTFFCFICRALRASQSGTTADRLLNSDEPTTEPSRGNTTDSTAFKGESDCSLDGPTSAPLIIKRITKVKARAVDATSTSGKIESVFQDTLQRYLKELDIRFSICSMPHLESSSASMPASQNNISCLTSPRLSRKKFGQNGNIGRSSSVTDSILRNVDESATKSWITYDMFKKRMFWTFSDINLDNSDISQFSKSNENLALVLQFLYQNCPINPRQWDIAISVVNYSLFLLEWELKQLCRVTQDFLQISRFEPSGSAADGTLIGSADRFDVLLVFDITTSSELIALHNNCSEEIPPGHVALGLREKGSSKESQMYSRKACVGSVLASYLQTQSVLERIETLLKKAVLCLNRMHKNKLDSLPFSFQMSQSKKLVLTLDTRLLHSFGLGLGEINIRITPALNLSVPEYCLLPSLFAVPVKKSSASTMPAQGPTGKGAISKLFCAPGISDLLWMIHTERVQTALVRHFESQLTCHEDRIYHRECLMVLKALFSPSNNNKLLNKGEVDSYILSTVLGFLLQESPPSAWSLENLANRVSDAVHFLRAAYENAWLPELSIHNPHLTGKVPGLEVMRQLIQGRQRNLLAHVSSQASLKVLDYITQRLNETRLARCVNVQFSPDLWEYEFFMFG